MEYTKNYISPLGNIMLSSDGEHLTGLWFENQKYYAATLDPAHETKDIPVFEETKRWLDVYFAGKCPDFLPPLAPKGSDFRQLVWKILCAIPYGETITYGEISQKTAQIMGRKSMSAQAVGGAVGHNPISVIIPCHRVVGADKSLTGYAGGVEKKRWMLEMENSSLTSSK